MTGSVPGDHSDSPTVADIFLQEIQEKEYLVTDDLDISQEQDEKLRRSLQGIANMTKLFQLLRERFSQANATWRNFNSPRGDVLYFADLDDNEVRGALHKIEESFEIMAQLETTLIRLQHTCEQSAKIVS
jgi:hypothetical protein